MPVKTVRIPGFFDKSKADQVWPVLYQQREKDAIEFRKANGIKHWTQDKVKVCLLLIDDQITFCVPPPWGQLFVGGRSGRGAVDDSIRQCEFIYKYLGVITKIIPTLDTHMANQIFHGAFWVDEKGETIDATYAPFIELEDVKSGKRRPNPALAVELANGDYAWLQAYALHYVQTLANNGQYKLELWPYHGMLGGASHALVPLIEEAAFFHNVVRNSQTQWEIKGGLCLTENYSVLQPEVLMRHDGKPVAQKNARLIKTLLDYDMVIAGGQAGSHCFAWTMEHLRKEIKDKDPSLAKKVYILKDCTSPVVIPGVIDFTDLQNAAFDRFAADGMHVVKSTDPIESWPDSPLK
jgi:nicotinamidase-related amidase